MDVEVELSRVIINEASDQQVILLKERGGERSFPIVIGIVEIFAIDRNLKGIETPRPMTHDLVNNVIKGVGGRIEKVVISDLRDHTFYAVLHLIVDGQAIEVDSRPSDAIAIALSAQAPVFVADHVFDRVCQ